MDHGPPPLFKDRDDRHIGSEHPKQHFGLIDFFLGITVK